MAKANKIILLGIVALCSVTAANAQSERGARGSSRGEESRGGATSRSEGENVVRTRSTRADEVDRSQAARSQSSQVNGGGYDSRGDRRGNGQPEPARREVNDRNYSQGNDGRPNMGSYPDRGNAEVRYNGNGRDWNRGDDRHHNPHYRAESYNRGYARGYQRRYEGRYEGRWNSSCEVSFKQYGYGRPRYVYYRDQRLYRTPYYIGVIRVKPPVYRGMPRIVYPTYRVNSPVVVYRPIWAPEYSFVRRFVFFPRLNIYWDNYSNAYVYFSNTRWISTTRLPSLYAGINISMEPMFEVEENYNSSDDGYGDDGYYYYE